MLSALRKYSFKHSFHFSLPLTASIQPPFEQEGDISSPMSAARLAEASIHVRSPILARSCENGLAIYPFSNDPQKFVQVLNRLPSDPLRWVSRASLFWVKG